MKEITKLAGVVSDDAYFNGMLESLKDSIFQWNYFVNWEKVKSGVAGIEKELLLLSSLIGKKNIKEEAKALFLEYPKTIKAVPTLLALRLEKQKKVKMLVDIERFLYDEFDFSCDTELTSAAATKIADFIVNAGFGEILSEKTIRANLVDYALGVEAGLDSNGRKNRCGLLMEQIVGLHVKSACAAGCAEYIPQAKADEIKRRWGIAVLEGKSKHAIDFAVKLKSNRTLCFIETNFYSGDGSKLKATAGEYLERYNILKKQHIRLIWVTDGKGWLSTERPLNDYFCQADYLMNLESLKKGLLKSLFKSFSIEKEQA